MDYPDWWPFLFRNKIVFFNTKKYNFLSKTLASFVVQIFFIQMSVKLFIFILLIYSLTCEVLHKFHLIQKSFKISSFAQLSIKFERKKKHRITFIESFLFFSNKKRSHFIKNSPMSEKTHKYYFLPDDSIYEIQNCYREWVVQLKEVRKQFTRLNIITDRTCRPIAKEWFSNSIYKLIWLASGSHTRFQRVHLNFALVRMKYTFTSSK